MVSRLVAFGGWIALALAAAPAIPATPPAEANCEAAAKRGDLGAAGNCWNERASRAANSGDITSAASAWLHAGDALGRAGQPEEALRALDQAAAAAPDSETALRANLGRAPLLLALGAQTEAMAVLDQSLESARDEAPDLVGAIQNNRGGLLLELGETSQARAAFGEAETAARREGNLALALRAAANDAGAGAAESDAAALRQRCAKLLEESAALPADQRTHLALHLGRTLENLSPRDPRAALDAVQAFEVARQLALELGDERSRSYALGYEGRIYASRGRREEALELTLRAALAAEVADAPHALYRWQWQSGQLQRDAGQLDAAIVSYRQAIHSLTRIRAESGSLYGPGSTWFQAAVEPVHFELVDLLLIAAGQSTDPATEQALLAEARDTLEDLKAAELRDYFQDECVDAQRRASVETIPGAVIVYPVVLPDRLELITSDGETLRRFGVPVGRDTLVAEVRRFRRFLEKRTTHEYRSSARTLYGWLIAPIENALAAETTDTVVFVPGGALRTIPFGALMNPATDRFLIEGISIAVTPGMTLTDPQRISQRQLEVLSAGLSEARQGFSRLDNVEREIAAVRDVFPEGRELLDEAFVRTALEQEIEERQPGIVHIASHAAFREDVSESFVLTYDEQISWSDVGDLLEVARFRERPVELITLSACETAVGDDRGALGLAGVTVRAGARSALATLWAVDDRSSAELTGEFYRQLETEGQTRAGALRAAQQRVLAERRYRHPGFWAPYLLVGSWL